MSNKRTMISGKHIAIFFTIFFTIICIFYTFVFVNAKSNQVVNKQPTTQSTNATPIKK